MKSLFSLCLSVLLLVSGCATPGPPRNYIFERDSSQFYKTKDGRILKVTPDGTVIEATCALDYEDYSCRKVDVKEWGKAIGKVEKVGDDWDMTGYNIDPETGTCQPIFGMVYDPRHSCWNRLWEVPAFIVMFPVIVALFILIPDIPEKTSE